MFVIAKQAPSGTTGDPNATENYLDEASSSLRGTYFYTPNGFTELMSELGDLDHFKLFMSMYGVWVKI